MSSPTGPTAVLHLATWLPPDLHAEFSAWCDEHHREQLAVPGFRRARRFEWITSEHDDDPPQFLTMYDLDSLEAIPAATGGLPDFLRGRLRVRRRECEILAALPSPWWPPTSTPLLDVFHLNDDALAVELRAHMSQVPAPAGFTLRIIDSADDTPLVLVDHDDSTTDLIDTITAASGSSRSSWRCCFDEQRPSSS